MKKHERITKNIEADKELMRDIASVQYYDVETFIQHGQEWIEAIKQRRMVCVIDTVSRPGMSRTMKFLSCEKYSDRKEYWQHSYWSFMKALGYSSRKHSDYFTISGCGMDMVFATNYNIIHALKRLGFISAKQCSKLAQMTPVVL